MSLTVMNRQYIPADHWLGDRLWDTFVPMLSSALDRQRQRDENRKQNAMRGEVLKRLGEQYQGGQAAHLPEPEGYNSNPWAQAAHQNGSPLAQFDAGTADLLLPPSTQRKAPNMQDIYNVYGQIASDPRFSSVSPDWIDKATQAHMNVAEAQRMNDLRSGYVNDLRNAGTWDDRVNILTQANLDGATNVDTLNTVSDYAKYRQPNYQPYTQNRGGSTGYGSFNPATGEWTQYGEYGNTLTPQEQQTAQQWNKTFDEDNRRWGIERGDKRIDADRDYDLKKLEIETRNAGQISPMDKARADALVTRMNHNQSAITSIMAKRTQLPDNAKYGKYLDGEIARMQKEIEEDRAELYRILGLQQSNTQQRNTQNSIPTQRDLPPVPEQYRPQGTTEAQKQMQGVLKDGAKAGALGSALIAPLYMTSNNPALPVARGTQLALPASRDAASAAGATISQGMLGKIFSSLASHVGIASALAIIKDMLFPAAAGETPEELEALRKAQDADLGSIPETVPANTSPSKSPVAQNSGSFWPSVAGLFGATPAYADEEVAQQPNVSATPAPQQNTTISTPHSVGSLIIGNNKLNVTTPFHTARTHKNGSKYHHDAVDYAIPGGTELRLPDYGVPFTVTRVRNDRKGYGNYVDLTANINDHKVDLRLAHLQNGGVNVKVGQTLNAGDLIGLSGNTGNSRGKNGGYHLHLETRVDGKAVDPQNFMLETNSSNLLAGNNAPEVTGTTFNGEALPGLSPNGVFGASLTPMGMTGGGVRYTDVPYTDGNPFPDRLTDAEWQSGVERAQEIRDIQRITSMMSFTPNNPFADRISDAEWRSAWQQATREKQAIDAEHHNDLAYRYPSNPLPNKISSEEWSKAWQEAEFERSERQQWIDAERWATNPFTDKISPEEWERAWRGYENKNNLIPAVGSIDDRFLLSNTNTSYNLSSSAPAPKYADIIDGAAQKYGIDNELIQAIIQVESNWDTKATSDKGARGLMQLMPRTARSLGVRDAYDPAQNIDGGSKYIAQLIKQFGSVEKALMAYNGGPGNMNRGKIPKAARAYAKKVMGIYNSLKGQRQPAPQPQTAPALQQQKAPDGSNISWVNSANQPMMNASGEPFTDDLYNQWAEMIDAGEYRDVGLNTRADLDKWLADKGMRKVKPSIDRGLVCLNNANTVNLPADVYDADIAPELPNPQTSPASFPAPSFTDELNGTRPQDLQGMLDDLNGIAYGENPGWSAAFHNRFGSPSFVR